MIRSQQLLTPTKENLTQAFVDLWNAYMDVSVPFFDNLLNGIIDGLNGAGLGSAVGAARPFVPEPVLNFLDNWDGHL